MAGRSWVQQLPLLVGILGAGLLMGNRLWFTPELLLSQSRSDALGIVLSALLILTGLLWQQIQPADPESVGLTGEPRLWLSPTLTPDQQLEIGWITQSLLKATATRSLAIWWQGSLIVERGIFPAKSEGGDWQPGTIGQRVLSTGRSVYLVDLKLFPGRREFIPLFPDNIQALLCQPLEQQGILLLATDTPRALTPRDQVWIELFAEKLTYLLQTNRKH
ncbi:MAG: cofactor assembly of complex C subunit B [Cyanobacteriota bacterium]|nr:cofactor assembly of complex C subunit B [Cyanobacteriota bacterium]